MERISYRNVDMTKQFLTKQIRKNAIGANPKAKRLKLLADSDRLFVSFGLIVSEDIIYILWETCLELFIQREARKEKPKFFHRLTF